MDVIDQFIACGVNRVIIGSAAIHNKQFLIEAVEKYGEQIAVSIDARNGYVATDGWTETSDVEAIELLRGLEMIGVATVVYTDILKDGMLQGPNFAELAVVNEDSSINIIASGGVSTEQDITMLKQMNLYGAIIGKALYEGNISLETLMEEENYGK